mgnify:CR=1 FL=1
MAQGIGHYVYPRYTRVVDTRENKNDINGAYSLISSSAVRNDMILDDTRLCVQEGRTPVILTRYKGAGKISLGSSANGCGSCIHSLWR